jgi:hypothetical protein
LHAWRIVLQNIKRQYLWEHRVWPRSGSLLAASILRCRTRPPAPSKRQDLRT